MFRLCLILYLLGVRAATKEEWRSRSIYQLITDRFAPPSPDTPCTDIRSYCGGTWRSTIDKLDYLQDLGFDSVWISPTGLGLEGYTKWGEGFHGYWPVDPFGTNPHFGTPADLLALSDALHARGMFLMVDLAVSALASTTTDITDAALAAKSDGKLLFQHQADYHPPCNIQFGNRKSEETCWLAQDGVALMHLRTGEARVADVLKENFAAYIKQYKIDGVRIDATRLMSKQFQHELCKAGNTFCMGEVHDPGTVFPASWTKGDGIDSVLGFGMMWGAVDVFARAKPMSALSARAKAAATEYADPTLIGAFIDNHDLPRFNSLTTDKSNVYNAMSLMILFGGIPTMYYGLEQEISFGSHDPDNRAALWLFGNFGREGEGFQRIKKLNAIRKKMGELGGFHEVVGTEVGVTAGDIAFQRNGALLVLTNRGAGKGGDWTIDKAGFPAGAKVVDLLSCSTSTAAADGSLIVSFVNGLPSFYVTTEAADKTGICAVTPAIPAPTSSSVAASLSVAVSSVLASAADPASTSATLSAESSIPAPSSAAPSLSASTILAPAPPTRTEKPPSAMSSSASAAASSPTDQPSPIGTPPTGQASHGAPEPSVAPPSESEPPKDGSPLPSGDPAPQPSASAAPSDTANPPNGDTAPPPPLAVDQSPVEGVPQRGPLLTDPPSEPIGEGLPASNDQPDSPAAPGSPPSGDGSAPPAEDQIVPVNQSGSASVDSPPETLEVGASVSASSGNKQSIPSGTARTSSARPISTGPAGAAGQTSGGARRIARFQMSIVLGGFLMAGFFAL